MMSIATQGATAQDTTAIAARVAALLEQPYPITITYDEDGTVIARCPDLPGCMAAEDTLEDTLALLRDAKAAWFERALEDGMTIPAPAVELATYSETELPPAATAAEALAYSGKVLVRMPKGVHRDLVARADAEGVSLNTLIVAYLAHSLGGSASAAA